jgi:hypothetical protein
MKVRFLPFYTRSALHEGLVVVVARALPNGHSLAKTSLMNVDR